MFKLILASALVAAIFALPQQREIRILRQDQDISPDGSYRWSYETENGISAQEQGQPKNIGNEPAIVAQGAFQWTSPEGIPIQIQYVADENGYQPSGDALPTPPPIPPAIAKALEWLARNPEPEERAPLRQKFF